VAALTAAAGLAAGVVAAATVVILLLLLLLLRLSQLLLWWRAWIWLGGGLWRGILARLRLRILAYQWLSRNRNEGTRIIAQDCTSEICLTTFLSTAC
jgi:hypothetical protein